MADTISKKLKEYSIKYKDYCLQYYRDKSGEINKETYKSFYDKVLVMASALSELGVKQGSHVAVISENRSEWLLIDQGLFALRAANVPRGADVTKGELEFILNYAECEIMFVENNSQLDKTVEIINTLPNIKIIVIIDGEKKDIPNKKVYTFEEVYKLGEGKDFSVIENIIDSGDKDDLATIIFTSGTTGDPKGVMLSQHNFLHQANIIDTKLVVTPGKDIWLSVLPVWHSYERIMQYIALCSGTAIAYSKPIGTVMLKDFEELNPAWLASVPRIWDALKTGIYKKVNSGSGVSRKLFHFFTNVCIFHRKLTDSLLGLTPRFKKRSRLLERVTVIIPWIIMAPLNFLGKVLVFNKIKKKFGDNFIAGISGGGSLPKHVEDFFSAAGILLLEGYGLTESAPVVALKHQKKPVRGTIGTPYGAELKVVDEDGNRLPYGKKGVLYVKGDQVMKGYLKRPDLTEKAIDKEGWLNTGDLAIMTYDGEFKIVGREKDTIVLLGGENLEPGPIEAKINESFYVQTAVVVGQDQKYLSALIVPDIDTLKDYADKNNLGYTDDDALCELPEVRELINHDISNLVSLSNGFKAFERIYKFKLLSKPFEVGKELSGKQDIKRHAINDLYRKDIEELFK